MLEIYKSMNSTATVSMGNNALAMNNHLCLNYIHTCTVTKQSKFVELANKMCGASERNAKGR